MIRVSFGAITRCVDYIYMTGFAKTALLIDTTEIQFTA